MGRTSLGTIPAQSSFHHPDIANAIDVERETGDFPFYPKIKLPTLALVGKRETLAR